MALELPDGTAIEDLSELVLRARVSAGWNGDNWTMASLDGRFCLGGDETPVFHHGFERFHGRDRDLVSHAADVCSRRTPAGGNEITSEA